jgi:hypothetical protein
MIIAITPSLNASSRLGDTRAYLTINHDSPHLSAVSVRNPRGAVNFQYFHCFSSWQTIVCRERARVLDYHCLKLDEGNETRGPLTIMPTKKSSAPKAFIAVIVCVIMAGFGWLSDPLAAADQTGALSRLLAWSTLAAAAIALIVAIYVTCRALTIREPQKDSDLEFEEDDSLRPRHQR